MKSALDFVKRNKKFVIIAASGIAVLGAVVLTPVIQNAVTPAKETVKVPAADSDRVIKDDTPTGTPGDSTEEIVDETPAAAAPEPAEPVEGDTGLPAYQNDGEWSPRESQTHLRPGDPNPIDRFNDPIVFQGVLMSDPDPVAEEFAKQWANPEGGHAAWLARLRPVIGDDAYASFSMVGIESVLTLKLTEIYVDRDPINLYNNFYRFTASYDGCGEVLVGTLEPQPEGSWLVDEVSDGGNSTVESRGNGCG